MNPILYAADETSFTTNGIGVLSDCISCIITEERNGQYTLEMEYPSNGLWVDEIETGCIIKAKANDVDDPQLFQINDVVRTLTGINTVEAQHISYRLSGIPVLPFTAAGVETALANIETYAVAPTGFTFETNKNTLKSYSFPFPRSARSILGGQEGSLLDQFGGEYHFDNFKVSLLTARGSNNGVTIRYGKNLTDIDQEVDGAVYNGILPYWYSEEDGAVYPTTPTVEGSPVVPCYEALDLTSEFEEKPTAAQLTAKAEAMVSGMGKPIETIEVSFITLHQVEEYGSLAALEHVALCDTVTVIYPDLRINAKMKVVKTVYNALVEMYDEITLGTLQTTLADVISNGGSGGSTAAGGGGVTYALSISGSSITLTGSDGSTSVVNVPDQYAGSATSGGTAYKAASIPFGEVDNTSTSTAFTATVPGITALSNGVCVMLKNGVVTSASGFTVNINGLGAKPCYSNMATGNPITPTNPTRETTVFNINYTMILIYSEDIVEDGGWIVYRGYDSNTNTIGYQIRTNSSALPASDKFYRYRLLFTSADGTKYVPANTSTSTNATANRTTNTRPIDPFGEILYYSTTAAVDAGSKPSVTAIWQQYTLTLGYSFNNTGAALTMTADKPVYLRCAPQADGSAVMEYFTQALPSTADGKIYIYLGIAYSATAIELSLHHPVYYYNNSGIRLWTGA